MTEFERALCRLINQHSQENESHTPDYILAKYLMGCLDSFNGAVRARDVWYGVDLRPGMTTARKASNHESSTTG